MKEIKDFSPVLTQSSLFAGLTLSEILGLTSCLEARLFHYKTDAVLVESGTAPRRIFLLLEGEVQIGSVDFWGNRTLLSRVLPGETFGEAYPDAKSGPFLWDVIASSDSTVLSLDPSRVLTTCTKACPFHSTVVRNLFFSSARRNRMLVTRIHHLSRRSTREKLISYLSSEATRQGSADFSIPFDRQQLADFLCVERSAMSAALSKMKEDGLIRYTKNRFTLLDL